MKPNVKLAETTTPDGARLILYEHDRNYCIRLNGQDLMHSAVTAPELLLGELAVRRLAGKSNGVVLIGGLGLGFTLKSVLQHAGQEAMIQVAELVPEVVEWNRTLLLGLNGGLLNDPRVEVLITHVADLIARVEKPTYDAIILDIDNGPTTVLKEQNSRLYSRNGIQRIAKALKPGGCAAFWSARPDPAFSERLGRSGFTVETVCAKLYPTAKRYAATIYLGTKVEAPPP